MWFSGCTQQHKIFSKESLGGFASCDLGFPYAIMGIVDAQVPRLGCTALTFSRISRIFESTYLPVSGWVDFTWGIYILDGKAHIFFRSLLDSCFFSLFPEQPAAPPLFPFSVCFPSVFRLSLVSFFLLLLSVCEGRFCLSFVERATLLLRLCLCFRES